MFMKSQFRNHRMLNQLIRPNSQIRHSVRVRFAPSPTGFLHLGGLRTALYNFLFAKSQKGIFILRIEDTDQSRLVPGATGKLQSALAWAGIGQDEGPFVGGYFGPYFQSERLALYKRHADQLVSSGKAYYCFCSEKLLDLIRKDALRRGQIPKYDNRCRHLNPDEAAETMKTQTPVVRFKLDQGEVTYSDLVLGEISHDPSESEGDPARCAWCGDGSAFQTLKSYFKIIIMKSDGYPTYHFANVVDDHLMEITHVLRGAEWQISTAKHLKMYKAFGWTPPQFAHLPLIVNKDGTKLSKRQNDIHIEQFQEKGYFPESVLNFVIGMGGGFGKSEDYQIYTCEEMAGKFSIERINPNPARLDMERLELFNRLAIEKRLSTESGTKSLISSFKQMIQEKYKNK